MGAFLRWPTASVTVTGWQLRYGTGIPPTVAYNAWASISPTFSTVNNDFRYDVTGLTNGEIYTFQIRRVTSGGFGPPVRRIHHLAASPSAVVNIPDANLRQIFVDLYGMTITQGPMANWTGLVKIDRPANVASLTGLEYALNAGYIELPGGTISDLSPLSRLWGLAEIDLSDNSITDISPLVANPHFRGSGVTVDLRGNPLTAASTQHILTLRARGVTVHYDGAIEETPPPPNDPPETTGTIDAVSLEAGQSVAYSGRDYFSDPYDGLASFSGSSSNPAVATVEASDWDTLTLNAVAEALAEVTLSATDFGGLSASLSFMVTVGNPASLGGVGELSAFASAPEGGVVELNVSLAKPSDVDATLTWSIGIDNDPATADADASDHGGAGGDVVIPAGETAAAITIPIADDADIEPAREVFVVSLTPQDGLALGVATATVHVEEGVCDRTPQVADELRGARDCAAVTSAELERRVWMRLEDAGLAELHPRDLLGMGGLTALFLDGNGLTELPDSLLSGLPALRWLLLRGNRFVAVPTLQGLPNLSVLDMGGNLLHELPATPFSNSPNLGHLRLDGNSIEELPASLIAGLRNLTQLHLHGNAIETVPDGFFNGFDKLYQLKMQDNPGAPFTVAVQLAVEEPTDGEDAMEGEDTTDGEDAVPSIRLSVPQGAPFDMSVPLTVAGGTIAAETATIAAGRMMGTPVEVLQGEDGGPVTVSIGSAPAFPPARCGFLDEDPCFHGIQLQIGEPVTLYDEPAAIIVPTLRR